ncbi:TonB-dependent receptor [Marinihelvus fidelis]|uniref:TonB-dependent receptor n=1 Tax=Marinihelvus fidelis TaxID=2613842 RepID=A0A5N0TCT9_9GAMM|nr:TonB-dependent receptor [Marinihelvus fidelis]KAA9131666.1 TonB-dependent receptor [Marinihelvus fidelis]
MANEPQSRQRFPLGTLGATVSAVCAGLPTAHAQVDGDDDTVQFNVLEEVIVTGTKRGELSLQDVPVSITALGEETIRTQGFKQLDDYFSQIPSLTFGRVEPGGTNVIMRGCAISGFAFGDNPTTGVYLDEQPITSAGFNPDPRLVDIERVEALAGPQGTTFGDASQCGTLRIITNKPKVGENEAWVDITGTKVDGGEAGYDANAMMNFGIGDNMALRLVGFSAHEAGYVDNVLSDSPRGTFDNAHVADKDVNGVDIYGARAALRWELGEAWTLDFQGIYQKTEQDGIGDADLDEKYWEGRGIGKWEQVRFNPETFDDEWSQLALTLEGDLGWGVLTATGSHFERDAHHTVDATTYLQGFQEINDYLRAYYNPYATIYDWGGDPNGFISERNDGKRDTLEIRLATTDELSGRWSALVGGFYNKTKQPRSPAITTVYGQGDNCNDYYAAAPGCSGAFTYLSYLQYYYFGTLGQPSDNWWTGIYENELTSAAIFGEFLFNITDNFSVTVGGRWYDIDTERTLVQGALIDPPGRAVNCGTEDDRLAWQDGGVPQDGFDLCFADIYADSSESGFVPKLNATWFWSDENMVYATYSEGFRRGGGNGGRRGSVFAATGEFGSYESDSLENFEIGSKNTLLGGRLTLNATFYHMIWDDIQIQAEDPDPTLFTVGIINFPQAEINGIEADFSWAVTDQFTLSGTLGYNDSELSEDAILWEGSEEEQPISKGTRLPLMPEWKYSLTGRFNFDGSLWGASPYLLGTWSYNGSSLNSLDGIQSSAVQTGVRETPSYDLLNVSFGLEADGWAASLFLNNAFNEYAQLFYSERYTQTRATVLAPRTFGINFRKYFN